MGRVDCGIAAVRRAVTMRSIRRSRRWTLFFASLCGSFASASCRAPEISASACTTNGDCADLEECVSGRCTARSALSCAYDVDCGHGSYCDPIENACRPRADDRCATDANCPSHLRCARASGTCVECLEPSDCTAPAFCDGGSCRVPSDRACDEDAACNAPSEVCEHGLCVSGCADARSPIACGLGTECDRATGRCRDIATFCLDDAKCHPPATICELGTCILGCAEISGLRCTGGYACDPSTGRCGPPTRCVNDGECGAPAAVCELGSCVAGCAELGGFACAMGWACDRTSGRCVEITPPCADDAACDAPRSVCELGQCIPGCGLVGGIQCNGDTTCNSSSGRCDPIGPACANDNACDPPTTICNVGTGACDPGCSTTGCRAPETCNTATGRCWNPSQTTGALPLNAACTSHGACASHVCFDFGASIGQRCVASCGEGNDCPSSFTCYDYFGAKVCVSSQLFDDATFGNADGYPCSSGGACHSNFCPDADVCVSTCSEDADCAGARCKWYAFASDVFVGACNGPMGALPNGAACTVDDDCRSGVCYGEGICGDLCGSTSDCPHGFACGFVNYSVCSIGVGSRCLRYTPNFVKACVSGAIGSDPIGAACRSAESCRDGLCHTALEQCIGACSRDADCPSTHVCGVENYGTLDDGTLVYINACMPR